jgi:hypothetical protein
MTKEDNYPPSLTIYDYQEKLREQQEMLKRYELDFNDLVESSATEIKSLQSLCDGLQNQLVIKENEIEAERSLKWIHFQNAAKFDAEVRELKKRLLVVDRWFQWQEWSNEFQLPNGWYWMRGFRHYRPLPVEIENGWLSMMFGTGHYSPVGR